MIKQTACECSQPGWCERHRCYKPRTLFLFCSRLPSMFQQWEMREGPGQDAQAPRPLPRCDHRGDEPLEWVTCTLCGAAQMQVPVFACQINGQCTERRYSHPQANEPVIAACTGCQHYAPREENCPQPVS